ncbi:MAG: serine/threonine protein kinase, partial [Planctomycetaceae bacterium]|nr:serine/threonine protein kinase [Planctomycetaceae bacterium]
MTNQLDHCLTDEQLRQLADAAAQFDLDGVEQHLDVCPDCCSRMGAIEQDAEWCEEILPVLRDAETIQELHASGAGHDLDAQAALRLLGPTDEPQYLGRIGTYEVTGVVGSGGMGIVYKTFDRSLDRFVAIKMMHPHLATSAAARQRFAREAKAAAAVIDDHVLPIYSVDQWQNVPYLVMQYSGGTTLEKRVATQGPLDVPEVLRIAMQTAHGLAAAHAQGLVHRDVKPSNILIDGTVERALLTDFGLARAVDDGSMTRTGMIAGTPQYMSPEQAHGDQLDHRSDLFSLGSVMYFMLTGRSPFRAETTMGVLNRIGHDAPRSLRSINPQVPVWLEDIVLRLLEKNRDQRYQSAQEVAELFGKWLA